MVTFKVLVFLLLVLQHFVLCFYRQTKMLPKIDKISNQTLNTGNQNNACAKKFFNTSKLGKENLETDVAAKKMGLRGPLISTDKSLNQTVIAKALQGKTIFKFQIYNLDII